MKVFTLTATINELIEDKRIYKVIQPQLKDIPQSIYGIPFEELVQYSKGLINKKSAEKILERANKVKAMDSEGSEQSILLWEHPPMYDADFGGRPYLDAYLLDYEAPAIIISPGGGYSYVSMENEGEPVAKAFNEKGFHAFVVRYRVAPNQFPIPQVDLSKAIEWVHSKSAHWKIMKDEIVLCGFSAGGHLTGSVAGLWNQDELAHLHTKNLPKPKAIILGYPVISFEKHVHQGSVESLLGPESRKDQRKSLSVNQLVSKDYPPTFIWTCEIDSAVSIENSIMMAKACQDAGIAYDFKIYPGGEHGVGLGIGLPAEKWLDDATEFIRKCL
jgi:acetyl esterase/lipase